MKADGSIIIDTKILDGGMEKGFELIKNEMSSVGITAKKAGEQIALSFSKMDVSKPVNNAIAKVKQLEQQLASVTSDMNFAISEGDDNSAERLANKRIAIYDRLEAAREKLSVELAHAVNKEAAAEEKASQRAIKAAEKETKAKQREVERQFKNLAKPAMRFGSRLREIVSGAFIFNLISAGLREITSYFGAALKSNKEFSASISKLKGALMTAFQPIYEVVLPALLSLMQVLTSFVQVIGSFFAAITGKSTAQMAENAKALNKQANAIKGVGNSAAEAKKQLMGFDELNKLNSQDTDSGGATDTAAPNFSGLNVDKYAEMVNRFIAPLREIDFTALETSLSGLGGAFFRLGQIIRDSLEWAWFEILVPLSQWTIEEAVPGAIDAFASALGMVSEVLGPVSDGLKLFWEWIQPVVSFVQDTVLMVFQNFKEAFDTLAQVFQEKGPQITGIISNIGEILSLTWKIIQPTMENLRELFDDVFSIVVEIVSKSIGRLIEIFYHLTEFVAGVLSQDWQRAWEGLKGIADNAISFIKELVLGLKDLIGRIIEGIIQAIFDVFTAIGNFFGGTSSATSTSTQSATPQAAYTRMEAPYKNPPLIAVPALARGAVLPPNKPFLAMVGDQRSGTNVEAPLSTIQEAVRMEIGNQLQTTNELLRRILEKETDVFLDGNKVGESVSRYQRRRARSGGY